MRNNLLLIIFLLLLTKIVLGQQDFTFNTPGNICYFHYICYAPNENYDEYNRPFIMILAEQNQNAETAFKNDSLKNLTQFNNYMFVYIPNKGNNAYEKLKCFDALSSLITFGYKYGHNNLFLQINDSTIKAKDLTNTILSNTFKSVRFCNNINIKKTRDSTDFNYDITTDFKESIIMEEGEKEDESGTFYYNTDETDSSEVADVKEQKIYFGSPVSFKYTLTGIIKDKSTGEALPFATIQVKGTTNAVVSNTDGYFTILNVPTDTNTLIVYYIGFNKTEVYLTPHKPKKNLLIELRPSSQTLKTVTITANKEDIVLIDKMDVSMIKLTPRKLEQLPNIGERDVMRSFQLMPGISASNESSSGLYVRGGTPDQNLILYDGFTVYQVDHLYGFFSAFNSNALKDVQLYKGGFESCFGGRLSSVTEITGKDGNQKKFNIGADLSLLSFNTFVEIPIGKRFSSVISFRKSYKGPIYNKIFKNFNKSSVSTTTIPQGEGFGGRMSQETKITSYFYDLNGKFTYRPNDKDILSLSIFNGTDKLDNGFSMQSPSFGSSNSNFNNNSTDLTKYGNVGSSLKWSRKWSSKLYGNTILSYSNYYSKRDRSQERTSINTSGESVTNKNGIFEKNNLKDFSIKSDYEYNVFNHSQLQFGCFATDYNINYTYAQNDTNTILDRHDKSYLAGIYLQTKTKLLKNKVQFIPGIRTSFFETTGNVYYEPRASLSLSLTEKTSLKFSSGKYYQFANRVTREDILSGGKDFWILSDGNSVPISSAIHYIAGISYETNNYLFSAEGYYKKITGLTEYSLRINASPMKINYEENFFNGYGYSKGIEFLAQKKFGNFNGWMSYTLGEAKNHFDVYSDKYYPANQDVTHEFKIVALYKYKRWDFTATWIYATGRPYTAPSGAYTITLLDGTTNDFFTVTSKNGLRLPDYHRCDISANYKLLSGERSAHKRREIGYIGFSIFNLYDRKNVWYKQYDIVDGTIITTNINYLGITPNIVLSLKLR